MFLHYFILAVSKNRAQLFEVTGDTVLPRGVDGMPASMEDAWKGMERHDESVQSHSSGNGNAMFHGQGGAKDVEEQEENQYMHALAKSLHTLLHEERRPLVFAGVTEEYGMFKKFDASGYLLEDYIQGSPDHHTSEELKAKADPIVRGHMLKQGEMFVEMYGNLLGTGRTSNDIDTILEAAEAGKVDLLLVTEGAEASDTRVQDAMAHTSAHRGKIATVEVGKIPENAVIGAVLRL